MSFKRGDVVWLEFTQTKGHEQKGRRPAVVLTPEEYNYKSELMMVCPMTTKKKGYPFEITTKKGVILTDQIRSVSWTKRKAQKKGTISEETMKQVAKMHELLLT